jgi:hypothetical protein
LFSLSGAHASWFGAADNTQSPAAAPYATWSHAQLKQWLADHHISIPSTPSSSQLQHLVKSNWESVSATGSAWSQGKYNKAQKSFQGLKESTFDSWDESRLREFLLEQGVVAPNGPRERLVLLAKQKYRGYNAAAASLSSEAYKTAGDFASSASSVASSATAAVVQATHDVTRKLDDTKDYVYSTWDDGRLRKFLEDRGIVDKKAAGKMSRQQMLDKMRDGYASVSEPVWETWSDSYIREWLLTHNLIPDTYDAKRATLLQQMKHYHYSLSDTFFPTWSTSQLHSWLVAHNYLKSDQQLHREKLLHLVRSHYLSTSDSFWSAWSDSDMRAWLIQNGYMRSDAQAKRDELVKAINTHYTDTASRTAAYLTWPDARLRAYLRERGLSEKALPTSRPGLLQETRIRWVQTTHLADTYYARLKHVIYSSLACAQEMLGRVLEVISGTSTRAGEEAYEKAQKGKEYAGEKAKEYAGEKMKGDL